MGRLGRLLVVAISLKYVQAVPATDPTSFWKSGFYDSCAITSCFVPITNSYPCEINDNNCVCTTSDFVSQVAACLARSCSSVVYTTYSIYKSNCAASGYSLALSQTQFLAASGTLQSWLAANFWNFYPTCVNNGCLSPLTAASGCDISTNECVCSNATLITSIAQCVGKSCSSTAVSSTYDQYQSACLSNGGYSIALSSQQWESAAGSVSVDSASSTASSYRSTANQIVTVESSRTTSVAAAFTTIVSDTTTGQASAPSSTAQSTGGGGGKGFTLDQKIALGVGLGIGIPTMILTALALCIKR